MNTLHHNPLADHLEFSRDTFTVYLKDARVLSVPLIWFPKLSGAKISQLKNYELLGDGEGIHWPEIDEDLSIEGLLMGNALHITAA